MAEDGKRSHNPRVRALFSDPLYSQVQAWLEGASWSSCKLFLEWCAPLAFLLCVERLVESLHASTKRRSDCAPNHMIVYDSISLRSSEMGREVSLNPHFGRQLADHAQECRSLLKVVDRLGMWEHPQRIKYSNEQKYKDTELRDAIYRADNESMFRPPPPIEINPLLLPGKGDNSGNDEGDRVKRLAEGNDTHEMLRVAGLAVIRDEMGFSKGEAPDCIYCLDYCEQSIKVLSCDPTLSSDKAHRAAREAILGKSPAGTIRIAFRSLGFSSKRMKRMRGIHQDDFGDDDAAIALHRIKELRWQTKTLMVDASPAMSQSGALRAVPIVISFDAFTLEQLQDLCRFKCDSEFEYRLARPLRDKMPYPGEISQCNDFLRRLCNKLEHLEGEHSKDWVHKKEHIAFLIQENIIEENIQEGPPYKLKLADWQDHIEVLEVCWPDIAILSTRSPDLDVHPSKMNKYELLRKMNKYELLCFLLYGEPKWQHVAVSRQSELRKQDAYTHSGGEKTFFTIHGKPEISINYLLALATAAEHKKEVPHGATETTYCKVLGKEPPVSKKRKSSFKFLDGEWEEEKAKEPSKKRKRKCRWRLSSTSSSSSSSSSECSSENSSSESPSRSSINLRLNYNRCTLTSTKRVGEYKIVCRHPGHGRCVRYRAEKISGGVDACVHQLKQWAAISTHCEDRLAHLLAWNTIVEPCIASGTLQTIEELDRILDSPWRVGDQD